MGLVTSEQMAKHAAAIRALNSRLAQTQSALTQALGDLAELRSRPRTVTEEIDSIPGRRIESIFSGEIDFDINDLGQAGRPIIIPISQDGDFIMTHYPMALWRPSAPTNATNLGRWRPVTSYPLPTMEVPGDIIDISYQLDDAGSQRFMQNDPRGPVLSRPDNLVPCAIPTQWAPNASIKFTPIYNAFLWNGGGSEGAVPPTQGTLHVDLIGYRIVNL
jgi:hypothetical protein